MASFSWTKKDAGKLRVKTFLAQHGVSHRMFTVMKHGNGDILLNGQHIRTIDDLDQGDTVTIVMPPEESNEIVIASNEPIEILYEDDNWLLVDKTAGITSVPGKADRENTMVNRVKGYLAAQHATDLVPHVVTRLDRFTSGVALLAKHRFAHALLDKQLKVHAVDKRYYALVDGDLPDDYGLIDAPIGRMDDDFIRREVRADGRASQTEYWVVKRFGNQTLVRVKLHTGRTHQIRVHFSYLGHPLVGDEVYGGPLDRGIDRQALHAYKLTYYDPFTQGDRTVEAPLPADMQRIIE
ncbi:RluA family pseudouridine synthase [Weissella muntiaci]|uniref:Pseudouridine synthase n=1 Tax=Weissella muntiaci TaxID=2508881 RepID=A0A6C2C1V8_9LACO|nr:RluA family pseudouridine synthase [Weissella muntiaci]TYC47777.1 RluA family pseudouridine synthase [Weissella muntiaci]